jgi:hypothetical protein
MASVAQYGHSAHVPLALSVAEASLLTHSTISLGGKIRRHQKQPQSGLQAQPC